ncbi:site-specific integrase [Dysgonomonas sp. Marseille-P4677]|uniref:tyrosine-type recombinase/integrase n=1 Tax=Dysgonomonas sp. Marseille-P4677 TaxID=2364790 RepID=UPI001913A652|nr:site-specific integrase [Dysgonomonas sp. Marseille-P4677]MBK5721107.1 site-specific integrase [Dysgonomonas sp. Marseille-P4677]
MSINIVFRPSRTKHEEGYLSLRVYYGKQVRQLATGLRLNSLEWDHKNARIVMIDFSPERKNYIQRLNTELRNKIFHLERLLAVYKEKKDFDIEHLVSEFRLSSFPNSFSAYVHLLAEKLIRQNRYRTAEAYLTLMRRLTRFNQNKDFSLDKITVDFVEDFERLLYAQGLSLNSISFYMRNLRAIYNKAIADKILMLNLDNPFFRVYTGVRSTPKRALSKEEINQVYSLDLSYVLKEKAKNNNEQRKIKELDQSRDLFMFSFHARGMSFVDMAFLKKTDIKNGILSYRRKKTGQQLDIKINQSLRKLINKYSKATAGSPYVFPIIKYLNKDVYSQYLRALGQQNHNLKVIQRLAGVTRPITTHVARHTWATIAKEENLPIWTISEGLGHSSVKTTYIYLASINRTKLDEANDIVARAVGF